MKIDLLIYNASQLLTCAGPGPKRGAAERGATERGASMQDVGLIPGGAVAVSDGVIVAVGPSADLLADYSANETIDAAGKVVCPGFVDPHTHAVYAGDRVGEFEQRLRGATYLEILQAGGGILNTVRATRAASLDQLVFESRRRLDAMLRLGTTTVEIKTGYGLNTASEIKMLRAIEQLAQTHPLDLIPTWLGAHAVPPEYSGRADAYVDLLVDEMLPAVLDWHRHSLFPSSLFPCFCDVFCEQGAFDLGQSRYILESARAFGLPLKVHADEFTSLGGVGLAVELGAVSVDHLDVTLPDEVERLARSDTVGVILPPVNLHLGSAHWADARGMVDAGVALAVATDLNPGSAPCPSLPLAMALACRYGRLVPGEALNAATLNAAYAVGLGERLGSLEPGKQADLLIVDAPDYRYLTYWLGENLVERVIKRGRIVM
ncbi:MAG: imidazolonepropionase [Anaerolineae bacterium]|nr:imidazolonepropionase [Anaerolineae bacterium]